MKILFSFLMIVTVIFMGLHLWRWIDNRLALRNWAALESSATGGPDVFSPDLVKDLPQAAQRFFLYTIKPGAPLYQAAEIETRGELGLGPKDNPGYMPMHGVQIVAPPHGYVWRLKAGKGPIKLSGHEGAAFGKSWIRFRAFGTVPFARAGGDPDHYAAAFGRLIADGLIWTPATFLPLYGAKWTHISPSTARVTITHDGLEQSVEITVAANGEPIQISLQRWSDVNPQNEYRFQPFGGTLSAFEDFDGYRLATRVDAGNHFGTQSYFPFYKAEVLGIEFLPRPQAQTKNSKSR